MTNVTPFDRELERFAETIQRTLSDGEQEGYLPTILLNYPDESLFLGLFETEEEPSGPEVYDLLYEFGRVQGRIRRDPQYVFVAFQTEWEDGSASVVVSGATLEGHKNGVRLSLAHRPEGGIKVVDVQVLKEGGATFEGKTCAGEFVRGFLEAHPRG